MAKPEWGTKRVCQSCATKFYDLGSSPIICPKCSARFDPEALLKSRRSRPDAPAKPLKSKPAKPAEVPVDTATDSASDKDEKSHAGLSEDDENADPVPENDSEPGKDDDVSNILGRRGGDEKSD